MNDHGNENDPLDLLFAKEVDAVNAIMTADDDKIEIKHSMRYQNKKGQDYKTIRVDNSVFYAEEQHNDAFAEFELITKG